MPEKFIIIKGAREHNLKNIDVKIPIDKITVITGLSGSGKSSLAFDTLYAETMTGSMQTAIRETNRRRKIQIAYNIKHKITPQSIVKAIKEEEVVIVPGELGNDLKIDELIIELEAEMHTVAENLDFERAIELREKIQKLKSSLK